MLPIPEKDFITFLVKAKQSTYAAHQPQYRVEPILSNSTQYEFRQGALLYRDIYFGMRYFVGQEIVYHTSEPIWGMSFAGGVSPELPEVEINDVYDFLRVALREITREHPFRGPKNYERESYTYTNRVLGDFKRFSGTEAISHVGRSVYQLNYSGGLLS